MIHESWGWVSVNDKPALVNNEAIEVQIKIKYPLCYGEPSEIMLGHYDRNTWWIKLEIGHRDIITFDVDMEVTHWRKLDIECHEYLGYALIFKCATVCAKLSNCRLTNQRTEIIEEEKLGEMNHLKENSER